MFYLLYTPNFPNMENAVVSYLFTLLDVEREVLVRN